MVDEAYVLVKFIPHKCWVDAHRHGIHMQLASRYFDTEKDDPGGVYDKYDLGVAAGHESITFTLWQRGYEDKKIKINTLHNLREPAIIRYKNADRLYMTCFSYVPVTYSDSKVSGQFDRGFLEVFGRHAVIIKRPHIFLNRIYDAAVEKGYAMRAGEVEYYEQPNVPNFADFERTLFSKRVQYEWQQEYRIIVDPKVTGEPPPDFFFDLKMEDISGRCSFE